MSAQVTLRFHRHLYLGEQVDAAVKALGNFGEFVLREEPTHWVVEVTCATETRARRVARELGNHALGRTIQARRAEAEGASA